jgi:hypothetical protein
MRKYLANLLRALAQRLYRQSVWQVWQRDAWALDNTDQCVAVHIDEASANQHAEAQEARSEAYGDSVSFYVLPATVNDAHTTVTEVSQILEEMKSCAVQ